VLAGFDIAGIAHNLDALGYPYQQVSDNSASRTFLTVQ
jgi:hypothetical protein